MAFFRFSMQNILELKKKMEEQERLEYTAVRNRLEEERQILSDLNQKVVYYEQILREELDEALHVNEIIRIRDGIGAIQWHIRDQETVISEWEQKEETAREKLLEAVRERKTYEKLREKAYAQFVAEEARAEQIAIDELVVYSYGSGR